MPCNLDKIRKIAKLSNLDIIEDAAHAVGTTWKNFEKIGSHGSAVCFSFHPVKNLAMPTGGLISINHKNHKRFKQLLFSRRWCGITDRKEADYDVKELGWNYYMNEFSAVIGLTQLKKLEQMNKKRKAIAKKYYDEIKIKLKMPFDENCSYHLYWVLVKNRQKFRQKLFDNGIETGTHYKPIHLMSMYKKNNSLPRESRIFRDNTASAVPVGRFYQGIYHTLVMAPISSNTVAKCVYGISDNLATNVFAQAGKCRTYSICFACDTAPELESMAPKGMVKVFPRKIDLTNVKKLEKFKQTKVVDSMNGLKQEIEKREIWLKKFYS